MSDHLRQRRAVPPREHATVSDVDVRRDDQRSALVHRTQDVFKWMPCRTVRAARRTPTDSDRGIDVSEVGTDLEEDEQMYAFGRVGLKAGKRRDAPRPGCIGERPSRVDAPVVGNGDEIDVLCYAPIENRGVITILVS